CSARLLASAPLAALFWLVDARAAAPLPEEFRLVTTFPRRIFERPLEATAPHSHTSLEDAGLAGTRQQAFFVEV
ncbi:MAG: hypothetical protein SGPRY_001007, partial [Prymnesium sp.]